MTTTQKKIIKRWVEALRSGKYKQGKETLKTSDGKYCCLGVLCELAIKSRVITKKDFIDENRDRDEPKSREDDLSNRMDQVRDWAGLTDSTGGFKNKNGESISLAQLNDGFGAVIKAQSFKQIAKIIESKPEGLFESNEN